MTKEITIDGKLMPVHYGIRTIQEVLWKLDKDMGDLLVNNPAISLELITEVSAAALSEGSRRNGSDKRYTQDDVIDLIDDDESGELLGKFASLFSESIQVNADKLSKMGNALAGMNKQNPPSPKNKTK